MQCSQPLVLPRNKEPPGCTSAVDQDAFRWHRSSFSTRDYGGCIEASRWDVRNRKGKRAGAASEADGSDGMGPWLGCGTKRMKAPWPCSTDVFWGGRAGGSSANMKHESEPHLARGRHQRLLLLRRRLRH